MDNEDLSYLNFSNKIKKILEKKGIKTIEEINTNYMENVYNFIYDKIFKEYLYGLGILKKNEKKDNFNYENISNGFNNFFLSDNENDLLYDNIISTDEYSSLNYSFTSSNNEYKNNLNNSYNEIDSNNENNLNNSYNEIDINNENNLNNSYNEININNENNDINLNNKNIKRKKNLELFEKKINQIFKINKNNNDSYNKKKKIEIKDYLHIYSDFMKDLLLKDIKLKTQIKALNKLLPNKYENSKIFFFYGKYMYINKTILVNLLTDILIKNKNGSVIYVYCSYIIDTDYLINIIKEKLKNNENMFNDILNNFYIFRITDVNELLTFLKNIKHIYIEKNKNKEQDLKPFKNIISIGIYNLIKMLKNLNCFKISFTFHLIRELKQICTFLKIPIFIFDKSKNYKEKKIKNFKINEYENKIENKNENLYFKNEKLGNFFLKKDSIPYIDINYINENELNKDIEYDNISLSNETYSLNEEYEEYNQNEYKQYNQNEYKQYNQNEYKQYKQNEYENFKQNEYKNFKQNEYIEYNQNKELIEKNIKLDNTNNYIEDKLKEYFFIESKNILLKKSINKILISDYICKIFDVIIEIELIKKIKKNKLIRFTLIKSQNYKNNLYCYSYLKGKILCN